MSEFDVIRRIVDRIGEPPADVIVGPGDDCACVRCGESLLLLSDDAQVEDVHFTRDFIGMCDLGRRAAAVSISDVAAMGGTPLWLLASVVAPRDDEALLVPIGEGLSARAALDGCHLVGGNIAAGEKLVVSISVVGTVPGEPLRRSGSSPGDLIAVTGALGGASAGLARLRSEAGSSSSSEALIERWRQPPRRVPAGRALLGLATAAIDVSDGLLADLAHVMESSAVGARIETERVPLDEGVKLDQALGGGEDYELLVTVPPDARDETVRAVEATGCALSVIGQVVDASDGLVLVDGSGVETRVDPVGWDHFDSPQS